MRVKVIALGNRIMGDDGVAVKVAERLAEVSHQSGVEIVIGETDFGYIQSKLVEGEFVLILDAVQLGVRPGSVVIRPLDSLKGGWVEQYSQHQYSLLHLLQSCGSVKGYLIGIEIQEARFSLELSKTLEEKFDAICTEILEIVMTMVGSLQASGT